MKRLLLWGAGLMLLATAPAVAVASSTNAAGRADPAETNAPNRPVQGNRQTEAKPEAARATAGEDGGSESDAVDDPDAAARNLLRDAESEAAMADNKQPPAKTVAASGISGPTPLWVAGAIIVVLLLVAGLLWWSLQSRIAELEKKFGALDKLVRQLDQPGTAPEPFPLADVPRPPAARIGGYEAGWDAQQPERTPPPPRQQKPTVRAFGPATAALPRAAESTVSLAPLQEDLARLIANPAMRTADYDELLRRYGDPRGYEVKAEDGSGRLTPNDGDAGRRLTALILTGTDVVALLPSARFIREFVVYKERLEAGSDVKALFELHADGSAHLRIDKLAYGRAGPDGAVYGVNRGQLDGFLQ